MLVAHFNRRNKRKLKFWKLFASVSSYILLDQLKKIKTKYWKLSALPLSLLVNTPVVQISKSHVIHKPAPWGDHNTPSALYVWEVAILINHNKLTVECNM